MNHIYRLESSLSDRVRFDSDVERMICEDQEIGGYSVDCYAAELLANLDIASVGSEDAESAAWVVDDLGEARARVRAVVETVLPREQAERAAVIADQTALDVLEAQSQL